jgi:hypothetical protein
MVEQKGKNKNYFLQTKTPLNFETDKKTGKTKKKIDCMYLNTTKDSVAPSLSQSHSKK